LYDNVVNFTKSLISAPQPEIVVDQSLLLPGRERYIEEAKEVFAKYNREIQRACEAFQGEERSEHILAIIKKFRYS
jgi:hypothetical protein